jgi:hypothetical protein
MILSGKPEMADNKPNILKQTTDLLGKTGRAVSKDFLQQSGLGRLAGTISQLRLGKKVAGAKAPPNFDVRFEGAKDFRVKLKVPSQFLTPSGYLTMWPIVNNGGIVFPFTPSISQEYTANYSAMNPTHSNYTQYFYKNSAAGAISVSGKFSVQNEEDAYLWLSTCHILRALTKMKFGTDINAGAPPPVCRFFAYGEQQYYNVPVVIQSFKVDLPDNVDYYATRLNDETGQISGDAPTGNMVPTISQISLTLLPMYSRQELLGVKQVDDYLQGAPNLRRQGYL